MYVSWLFSWTHKGWYLICARKLTTDVTDWSASESTPAPQDNPLEMRETLDLYDRAKQSDAFKKDLHIMLLRPVNALGSSLSFVGRFASSSIYQKQHVVPMPLYQSRIAFSMALYSIFLSSDRDHATNHFFASRTISNFKRILVREFNSGVMWA